MKMRSVKSRKAQGGVGIVEIMVALVVGALLIAGLSQVYTSGRMAYVLQDDMSRLQENGRFAFQVLSREARVAGYFGCRRNIDITNVLRSSNQVENFLFNFNEPVQGFEAAGAGWTPALPNGVAGLNPAAGSDILVLRSAASSQISVVAPFRIGPSQNSANTQVSAPHDLRPDDIVLISDCNTATVFQITNTQGNNVVVHNSGGSVSPGNSTTNLGAFDDGSHVSRVTSTIFYIAPGTGGRPALFRRSNIRPAEELADGVERMTVRYGVDRNGDGIVDEYARASRVQNQGWWGNVASVRISLLLSGARDNLIDEPQVLRFDDDLIEPGDRRLRHVMTTTVSLRNRTR